MWHWVLICGKLEDSQPTIEHLFLCPKAETDADQNVELITKTWP